MLFCERGAGDKRQHIALMRFGLSSGLINHRVLLEDARPQFHLQQHSRMLCEDSQQLRREYFITRPS